MSILERRNANIGVIEGLFIQKTLQDQAKVIMADTAKEMKGFANAAWNKRTITVSGDTMTYTHNINVRFIDMKSKRARKGYNPSTKKMRAGRNQKKSLPIHNKPLFRHKKYLQRQLAFGFSDEVKAIFEKMARENNLLKGQ